MNRLTSNICLFILGLLLFGYPISAQDDECRCPPGTLLVSADRIRTLNHSSGELLSIDGWRRVSSEKSNAISIYHVLIFHPKLPLIGARRLLSNKGPLSTEGLFWTVQKNPPDDYANGEEHSLEIRYHSLNNNVTVGKQTFNLSSGNLFVIRLDERWAPTVSQVSGHLTQRTTPDKVLKFFKSILRHDEIIQRLELSE
ncbi:MAG TPA: hypothetical protein DC054_02005 [Blastocatellia bacterium]|nr:hypothetical protein [Blastocatellia bacterium]